ncbi:excinuclease ABC subunit UvrC [Aliarcobacter cibarius]|jgi:excinuclease ABC subunit C|uniref:UvrABC system protein C n=1 Tax=Aliarcobacter cibarius TaxID=255507 RepID=A0A7L5JPF2_9BACT|nr:excinuclease ABC subunit UvrC [Aliarcobacter cibarius]MBP9491215.1 excinuclease ABC subunit UvrC [Aliarcobacter sp.]QKJ27077.1 UvrABC nucleotide excision repair complex, subunit UvrC [Aliarcobacter cibarius]TLS98593.1 excinuclease ABC subunit UvrC [Aliarcobacter cibarius]TLS99337.1 excinuclease ABC subunit UvrC [Aliarcobacter cibarius]TLT02755.1 excinuclease ABC subunit UvrC [Aliarcobacter cibarius]
MNLEEKLKLLPSEAGVYQYFDNQGHLLYIGKAKSLKNRVKSYFKFSPTLQASNDLSPRIYKMISETVFLEWIVVPNEHDALILENSLIKQLKPKYNVLLRDDKTYPYIFVDLNEDFPRLEITRKIEKGKNIKYFGPYSSGARDMLDSIYEIIPLVQKKSCVKSKKACLFFQIGKCLAPCENKVNKDEYKKILDEALGYIYNKSKLLNKLKEKMQFYSENFRFEEALVLRDRAKTIEKSEIKTGIDLTTNEDLDIFAIKSSNKKAVLVRMFIRDGKLASSNYDFMKTNDDVEFDIQEAYKRAIINYYSNELPIIPKEIIVADEIEDIITIEEFLYKKFNKKIKIVNPKIDKKASIVKIALNNCDELLRLENIKDENSIYNELKELFSLNCVPNIIETFDNSHLMGQATVGGMVVWNKGKENFDKKSYRHYNLESLDEYSQMKEMLYRRVESFDKNNPPDLWVIDGGTTLLNLAFDIVDSIGVNLDIIAISKQKVDAKAYRAKGNAKDIVHFKQNGEIKSLNLLPSDKRLQFIQRLRDEAHRFAISFHKKQKRKEDKEISLLQIKGIGEAKIKKLLLYFGEFEKIRNASFEELKSVLNEADAHNIINYFNN